MLVAILISIDNTCDLTSLIMLNAQDLTIGPNFKLARSFAFWNF